MKLLKNAAKLAIKTTSQIVAGLAVIVIIRVAFNPNPDPYLVILGRAFEIFIILCPSSFIFFTLLYWYLDRNE